MMESEMIRKAYKRQMDDEMRKQSIGSISAFCICVLVLSPILLFIEVKDWISRR